MTGSTRPELRDRPRAAIPVRSSVAPARRVGVVALLTIGLVALVVGGATALRDASVPATGEVGIVSETTDALAIEYVDAPSIELVDYDHGATVSYAVELRNDGPVAVTVEDVPVATMEADRRLIRPSRVLLAPEGAAATDAAEGARPFEPFRLERGARRTVLVEGIFDNCTYYTERAMDVIVAQPVTWSVAGWSTTTDVSLSRRLAVRSPYLRVCPGRVMDRGATTRSGTS